MIPSIYKLSGANKSLPEFKYSRTDTRFFSNRSTLIERWKCPLLFVFDLLAWSIAVFATYHIFPWYGDFELIYLIGPLFGVLTLSVIGSYNDRTDFFSFEYLSEHFLGLLFAALFSMFFVYLVFTYNLSVKPSRLYLPLLFGIYFILSIRCRRFLGRYLLKQNVNSAFLVIGDEEKSTEFERLYAESGLSRKLEIKKLEAVELIEGRKIPSSIEFEIMLMLVGKETNYAAVLLACETEQLSPQLLQCLIQTHCSGIPVLTMDAFLELHWHV